MARKKVLKSKFKHSPVTEIDLQSLANEGTKEAINKLNAFLKTEKDLNKRDYAVMALEECELFYYSPTNEKEEEEFLLCNIILQKEDHIKNLEMEINKVSAKLDRFALERKVHEKLLLKNKNKRGDWEYCCREEYMSADFERLKDLKDNIIYEKAWVAEAKKTIMTARYKPCIPKHYLDHFDIIDNEEADDLDDYDLGYYRGLTDSTSY